jgi:hypothetical protein
MEISSFEWKIFQECMPLQFEGDVHFEITPGRIEEFPFAVTPEFERKLSPAFESAVANPPLHFGFSSVEITHSYCDDWINHPLISLDSWLICDFQLCYDAGMIILPLTIRY